jgi:hypothetical protein
MRDQIVDFVRRWQERTEIGVGRFIGWLDITASKFYDWRERGTRLPLQHRRYSGVWSQYLDTTRDDHYRIELCGIQYHR